MKTFLITAVLFASAAALGTGAAHAQALKLPEQSPAATTLQTVGISDITVAYHRPAVNGRPIWGKLVPYGEVWRAGANENTLITFSTDVKIGGKPLRAGTYGLHMLPTAKDWTIIFSTATQSWGSFTYDPKEDALRATVTPRPTQTSEERLLYKFDDVTDNKATLVLAWEKLAVPVVIEVDTPKLVMANARLQLRGTTGFAAQNFDRAANYWVKNGGPLDEALKLTDHSIGQGETYRNLTIRATIVEKQGNAKAAADLRAKAQQVASEGELNQAAYQLLGDHKTDEAIKLLQLNAEHHPASANAQDSLGEALAQKGDKAGAIAAYTKAATLAKDPKDKKRIEASLAKLKSS
jgi:predicted negative regulator of RcsB-dependent stress response